MSSQSVRPVRRTALNFYSYHWQQKSRNLLKCCSESHSFALLPSSEPTLANAMHPPICSPTAAQAAFASRVAGANFFVSNDERGAWQCETHQNKFGTNSPNLRGGNKMWSSFIPSVQDFMPFERPVNARQRAPQWIGKIFKTKVCTFLVNGTVPPPAKARTRWNNRIKIAGTLRKRNPPDFQSPFVGMIPFSRL